MQSFFSSYYGTTYSWFDRFGTTNLTVQSPPQSFTEVLTLEDVKSYLKVPPRSPVDSDEDAELTALIVSAREQAEFCQDRDLVVKQYDRVFDYWMSYRIELGNPLNSVDLLQYKDSTGLVTTMVEGTDYIVDAAKRPGIISPPTNGLWPTFVPWPSSAVLIRFSSGLTATDPWWSNSGASVKTGMRLLISDWYNNRLPYATGKDALQEYPTRLLALLGAGSVPRAR